MHAVDRESRRHGVQARPAKWGASLGISHQIGFRFLCGKLAELGQPLHQRFRLRRGGEAADDFLRLAHGVGEAALLEQELKPHLVLLPLLDLGVLAQRAKLVAQAAGTRVVGEFFEQPLGVGQRARQSRRLMFDWTWS